MKRHVRIGTATTAAAFVLVTIYDVTVHGFLEPTSLFPSHFTAGAGSLSFLARFWLVVALLITAPFSLWNRARPAASLLISSAAGLAALLIFMWSAFGIQREAPQYEEREFDGIVADMLVQKSLTKQDVLRRIGPPLVRGQCYEGKECWSYTYMPTGGFGWAQRLIIFDDAGRAVSWMHNNEP